MRVLVVEDNRLNAYFLTRLLGTLPFDLDVKVVSNSFEALQYLECTYYDLIILDGDLGASGNHTVNGPILADMIWQKNSEQALVSWTDNPSMKCDFAKVFSKHSKLFCENTNWPKSVTTQRLSAYFSNLTSNTNYVHTAFGLRAKGLEPAYA